MTEEKMLTVREVSTILGISEKDVLDLTEKGAIPGYKVAGVYLRFKKEQVEQYKKNPERLKPVQSEDAGTLKGRVRDFFYFNDFYIFALVLIILLGYLVYQGL
ncbi:MAG: helix-turn-helix domain-containing protein [Candidatus Omnitrophica bacterium]|jgi:excisionase family DNA binding protein|nr:helix-turn-helix domain-containing protein [Candidatus Omnitrophota bacterium]MDD5078287.1 helix-turn-helix domain-containing protein [Candidatus Omnitrophota bacterium]